ncbi:ATP synthase subunit delta [Zalerion maritima]|uniref:ATP synthase subunit delta, mitochondrial n=1 Tax=Zalerion maritima TaxID=339359 RepID=A0AAD5WY82_9PEZI|nr:ATP synthase subunit delta [Zalerion maritima]
MTSANRLQYAESHVLLRPIAKTRYSAGYARKLRLANLLSCELKDPEAIFNEQLSCQSAMNSLRIARAAVWARPAGIRVPLQRRGYAEAVSDKSIYKSQEVVQVNIAADSGDMGVLANHVPVIEQLKPGAVTIIEEDGANKQFFLAGGFAYMLPNNNMDVAAVEGAPLEDFNPDAVKNLLAEAQKVASGSGSEQDIAEAKIEIEVCLAAGLPTPYQSLPYFYPPKPFPDQLFLPPVSKL